MIRTFLALPMEIGESLRSTCNKLQVQFNSEKLRWVKEENMHLTIRFFGDIEEGQVGEIASTLSASLSVALAGEISVRGLGTFENGTSYSVLWAGIEDPDPLREIKNIVDVALKEILPVKTHRHYRPHLTLARMKRIYERDRFLDEISQYETKDFGSYKLNRLVLFQSILGEQGPVYKELRSFVLE